MIYFKKPASHQKFFGQTRNCFLEFKAADVSPEMQAAKENPENFINLHQDESKINEIIYGLDVVAHDPKTGKLKNFIETEKAKYPLIPALKANPTAVEKADYDKKVTEREDKLKEIDTAEAKAHTDLWKLRDEAVNKVHEAFAKKTAELKALKEFSDRIAKNLSDDVNPDLLNDAEARADFANDKADDGIASLFEDDEVTDYLKTDFEGKTFEDGNVEDITMGLAAALYNPDADKDHQEEVTRFMSGLRTKENKKRGDQGVDVKDVVSQTLEHMGIPASAHGDIDAEDARKEAFDSPAGKLARDILKKDLPPQVQGMLLAELAKVNLRDQKLGEKTPEEIKKIVEENPAYKNVAGMVDFMNKIQSGSIDMSEPIDSEIATGVHVAGAGILGGIAVAFTGAMIGGKLGGAMAGGYGAAAGALIGAGSAIAYESGVRDEEGIKKAYLAMNALKKGKQVADYYALNSRYESWKQTSNQKDDVIEGKLKLLGDSPTRINSKSLSELDALIKAKEVSKATSGATPTAPQGEVPAGTPADQSGAAPATATGEKAAAGSKAEAAKGDGKSGPGSGAPGGRKGGGEKGGEKVEDKAKAKEKVAAAIKSGVAPILKWNKADLEKHNIESADDLQKYAMGAIKVPSNLPDGTYTLGDNKNIQVTVKNKKGSVQIAKGWAQTAYDNASKLEAPEKKTALTSAAKAAITSALTNSVLELPLGRIEGEVAVRLRSLSDADLPNGTTALLMVKGITLQVSKTAGKVNVDVMDQPGHVIEEEDVAAVDKPQVLSKLRGTVIGAIDGYLKKNPNLTISEICHKLRAQNISVPAGLPNNTHVYTYDGKGGSLRIHVGNNGKLNISWR